MTSGALGGFQRNIPGKALSDDHVNFAAADIVTLHEALVFDIGKILLAQDAPRLAHLFKPFCLLHADIEEPHRRPRQTEQNSRSSGAHQCQIDKVVGVRTDRCAHVEHNRFASQRGPQRRNRWPFDARQGFEVEFRHGHERAGIAGGHDHIGVALFHGVDREPHRRFPAAVAQSLARLVLHADGHFAMDEPRARLELRSDVEERSNQ